MRVFTATSTDEVLQIHRADAVITRPFKPAQLLVQAKTLLNLSWRETFRVLLNVAIEGTVSTNHFVCNSLDISLAGMLIETAQTFNQGDRLSCSFFMPNMTQIQLTGEIARTIQPVPGVDANWYGVHFLNLPPDAAKTLEAFIDTTPPYRVPVLAYNLPSAVPIPTHAGTWSRDGRAFNLYTWTCVCALQ
jgi:hypothetical protein